MSGSTQMTGIVWVLSALLVVAMLDRIPDPPGANPSSVQCKVLQLGDDSSRTATDSPNAIGTVYSAVIDLIPAETREPLRPSDWIVHAGLAADPSPPASAM